MALNVCSLFHDRHARLLKEIGKGAYAIAQTQPSYHHVYLVSPWENSDKHSAFIVLNSNYRKSPRWAFFKIYIGTRAIQCQNSAPTFSLFTLGPPFHPYFQSEINIAIQFRLLCQQRMLCRTINAERTLPVWDKSAFSKELKSENPDTPICSQYFTPFSSVLRMGSDWLSQQRYPPIVQIKF
jgi:hypothetical protein